MELKPVFRKLFGTDTKAVRIPMNPGDKKERFVQLKLENSFQFLDFLSLRLAETDAYRIFRADYGVVAGRVIGNEGIGIPNCRIAIFVPREEPVAAVNGVMTRKELESQLVGGMYPYEVFNDEDNQGRRYNILPSSSRNRGFNGFPENNLGIGATPKVPVGTFFEKEDLLTNPSLLSVYNKYYKYTTVTNASGDYMLFGVPTGTHTIHMDCDLTDIGPWSMSPLLMTQTLGYPKDLFEDDGSAIRPSNDLGTLPNIQSQNISVDVKPLWSQSPDDEDVIGISRQDFKITAAIRPYFTVFGSNFTMAKNRWWGDNLIVRLHFGWKNLCLQFGPRVSNSSCSGRFFFDLGVRIGFRIKILGNNYDIGNPDGSGFTFRVNPTLDIQVPNVMPFLRFEIGDNYCRLDGGKYDNNPIDIINHGRTCQCDIQDALQEIPDTGITDALFLRNHRIDPLQIKLFNLTGGTDTEAAAMNQAIHDTRTLSGATTSAAVAGFDPESDVELVRKGSYVELIEDGQFILQVQTNRRLMVTSENGTLIDSDDPRKGVFTEYRGYMYVTSDSEINNPATKDRAARIALKIPQAFEYSRKPKDWMLYHSLFQAGELYSVSQKIATKEANMSASVEAEADLDGVRNGVKGWDNQTGIIMDVQGATDATQTLADFAMSMVPNHDTHIGAEYTWEYPDGVGGSTLYQGDDQSGTTIVTQYDPPEPYADSIPTGKVDNNGITVIVNLAGTSSGDYLEVPYGSPGKIIILGPTGIKSLKFEIFAPNMAVKTVISDADINVEQGLDWDSRVPDELIGTPLTDSQGRSYVDLRIRVTDNLTSQAGWHGGVRLIITN